LSDSLVYLEQHFRARLTHRPDDGGSKHLTKSLLTTTLVSKPGIEATKIELYHTWTNKQVIINGT
jgi:hypothetical protein